MKQTFHQTILVDAPIEVVWDSLSIPERMKTWMGEPELEIGIDTDWSVGSPIVIRGYHHVRFENRGTVLEFAPRTWLSYTHLSSLSRLSVDEQANYSTLRFSLTPMDDATSLTLTITGFPTESIFRHMDLYWRGTLEVLRLHAEQHR
ncbi:SRPBCC family protein [Pseudoxanthomonas sacheonensis]|uniref:SRPBCC family protein n=1 Tax=Pseudoxanthomonas sacheonensis TaxID=443615 RepID=UPI0013D8DD0C|nr:SRPBCC domain-containing protein [Pseudoxanthomonas sacheonensis]KAF1707079.1 ATPase [Pseudoxanthomonas sacheonensis]